MQEMLTAITRAVSPSISACEFTYREREAIDIARARDEHRAYQACLADLGVEVFVEAAGEAPRQFGIDEGRGGAHLLQFDFYYCKTPAFLKSPAFT
jgi:hypothetical protein